MVIAAIHFHQCIGSTPLLVQTNGNEWGDSNDNGNQNNTTIKATFTADVFFTTKHSRGTRHDLVHTAFTRRAVSTQCIDSVDSVENLGWVLGRLHFEEE